MAEMTREQEIQQIHHRYADFYRIGGGLMLVLLGVWIGSILFRDGYATNLYTEALSVVVTILVLDQINQWRETQRTKSRLVREAGSRSNEVAIAAVEWLRAEHWLSGKTGLLKNAHLWSANLANSNLQEANLENAYMREANLENATAQSANFKGANLRRANLKNVQFGDAQLQHADMRNSDLGYAVFLRANLMNAKIEHSNFSGTNLRLANLKGADLPQASFDEQTVLPDADPTGRDKDGNLIFTKHWTTETDMTRYTDPNHPEFWQPDWAKDIEK